jgi:hypothetical protein
VKNSKLIKQNIGETHEIQSQEEKQYLLNWFQWCVLVDGSSNAVVVNAGFLPSPLQLIFSLDTKSKLLHI